MFSFKIVAYIKFKKYYIIFFENGSYYVQKGEMPWFVDLDRSCPSFLARKTVGQNR